jgi:DNA-binding NarL/FixJ family response regulator
MIKKRDIIRLLLVDDYELARNGLRFGFREHEGFEIIGEAENGQEAIELATKHRPDVILMDIAMPVMDGMEATQAIKAQFPHMKIIILTSRQEEHEVHAALSSGADAYCMKDVHTQRLIQAIEMVVDGGFWLDPAIAKMVMNLLRPKLPKGGKPAVGKQRYRIDLTERETEVLELIAKGKNNKEIAEDLGLSIHTVKAHVSSIMQKLSVDDRTEAAIKALKEGLIPEK